MSVYPVREDTLFVKENLNTQDLRQKKFLEIGVGNAEISLTAAEKDAEVTAVDINPGAVKHAKQRLAEEDQVGKVFRSDLFEEVGDRFDFIVFNPPYLKGEDGIGDEEMWRGGETGLEVAERFLEKVSGYLNDRGRAWIVLSSQTEFEKLVEKFELVEVDREKLWFETLFLFELE